MDKKVVVLPVVEQERTHLISKRDRCLSLILSFSK